MAVPGYVSTQLAALGRDTQAVLGRVFEYVLSNLKIGPPEHQKRAANLQWYCLRSQAPAIANTEWSIEHGLSGIPYVCIPVLDPREVDSTTDLKITRAADAKRIYLSCGVANAPVTVYVEGA